MSKKKGYKKYLNEGKIKKAIVTTGNLKEEHKFLAEVPYDIRAGAVIEMCSHHKSEVTKTYKRYYKTLWEYEKEIEKKTAARDKTESKKIKARHQTRIEELNNLIDNLKENPTYKPDIKFRQKKSKRLVIDITRAKCKVSSEGVISIYSTSLGSLATKEKIETLQHDIKISWDKSTGWYLIIPYDADNEKPDGVTDGEEIPDKKFIALDPGYRTFLTGVDSEGCIKEYGKGWYGSLRKNIYKLDSATKLMHKQREESRNKNLSYNDRQKWRVLSLRTKKRLQMCESKIRNKIDYMHKKISKDILNEYETVLLPKINTKSMLKNSTNKHLNRMINLGSQCKFHDYISYQGKDGVVKVDERYTTKTCARCMNRYEIGLSKIYICKECSYRADRDVNAAINILTKNIGRLSSLPMVDNANA